MLLGGSTIGKPGDVGGAQQELEELRYLQQLYQNQHAMIGRSISAQLSVLQGLNAAQKSLDSTDLVGGKETLVSIGADVYLHATTKSVDRVLVRVGGGWMVEKDVDSAKQRLAKLAERGNTNLNGMLKSRRQLEAALTDLAYKLESAYR